MKCNSLTRLFATATVLLALSAPKAAQAATVTLTVDHKSSSDVNHFNTIQAAIDHAANIFQTTPNTTDSFQILVQADPTPYTGSFTPISDVNIIGTSTAGTFIDGSGTVVNINNVARMSIRNFTFRSGTVAISVANNSSGINITNNIFRLGTAGTAVQVQSSADTSIVNNTFYNNGTAISTNSNNTIKNDIFSTNSTAISTTAAPLLSYNDFYQNTHNGVADLGAHSIPTSLKPNANPLFVDLGNKDFHLQSGSPAIDSGDPNLTDASDGSISDMGAYGGPNSDVVSTFPATVTGLTSSITSPDAAPTTISLTWNASTGSAKTYRVYFGLGSRDYSGITASVGDSPIAVTTNSATLTFNTLPPPPSAPAAPTLTSVVPLNKALKLSWTAVPDATGYRVYHQQSAFDSSNLPLPQPVESTKTSFTINGLSNGTTYFVAVSALKRAKIYAAVTAVVDSSIASNPGSDNESPFSEETSQGVGPTEESFISQVQSETPEAISPYPNLKSEGCFIATAAFGFYSAPQVQLLREFRDRYLLTNEPGRAFVAWYYRYGPIGAHFINLHPWLKPPVRLALLPLVAGSFFLMHTPPLAKVSLLIMLLLLSVYLYQRGQRKMLVQAGGTR